MTTVDKPNKELGSGTAVIVVGPVESPNGAVDQVREDRIYQVSSSVLSQ